MKTTVVTAAVFLFAATANAAPIVLSGAMSGANENPPIITPATGFAEVILDTVAQTMEVSVSFSGLTTPNIAAHIHCCVAPNGNAGVATITPTFTGFPSGVTAGTYDHIFDLTDVGTYNPNFITTEGSLANAEAALVAGILAGNAYLNIHTTLHSGGEIRAFLVEATPEPATFLLTGILLAGFLLLKITKHLTI